MQYIFDENLCHFMVTFIDEWRRKFPSCMVVKRLITFAVINQTPPNSHGSCRNNIQCCLQNYMENGWELTSILTSKWITFNNTRSNFTPISLITFAVNNQTLPNLQGSYHNNIQCCLQNYMENGWELTSELTSK